MGQAESMPLPVREKDPTFDPLYGFKNGRKERVNNVTLGEMESAKVPLEARGYCAEYYIKYNTCRRDKMPLLYRCGHEKHAYLKCQYDDFVLRMKEYERERRLLARAKRISAKKDREELHD